MGGAGWGPRRYRGKDITWWMAEIDLVQVTVDKLPSPKAKSGANAMMSGKDGAHTHNLHRFARDGVVLLGRMPSARGDKITFAPDLRENLAKTDKFEADLLKKIDDHIEKNGLDVPQESLPELQDGYDAELIAELDVQSAGITNMIWATSYQLDFSLVQLPVLD